MKMHYAHTYGDAYFCIPPYPFAGEGVIFYFKIIIYNLFMNFNKISWKLQFLFVKTDLQLVRIPRKTVTIEHIHNYERKREIRSPLGISWQIHKRTYSISNLIKFQRQIKVEYNQNLTEINKETMTATFKNVKTGEL